MKQVEATWEERNLGLRVLEITLDEVEEQDIVTAIGHASRNYDYTLIKVPSGNPALVHELEEHGFRFLETQLEIFKKLKSYEEPKGPILKEIQYRKVGSREGLDSVLEQIDEQMFVTDRVSLDPALGPEASARRVRNWLIDEFDESHSELFHLVYKDQKIGFFLVKDKSRRSLYGLLGGLYSEFVRSGLGMSIIMIPLRIAKERDKRLLETRISSNNSDVARLYSELGFSLRRTWYVLRMLETTRSHAM